MYLPAVIKSVEGPGLKLGIYLKDDFQFQQEGEHVSRSWYFNFY